MARAWPMAASGHTTDRSWLGTCCSICWIDDKGAATTFFSSPEMVFRPAVMIAQQGSTNWLRARVGARTIAATIMTANTILLFKNSDMGFKFLSFIFHLHVAITLLSWR